ncbi:hypothetical protein Btru_056618 [Bulinus truncatus]|nr:hypothetical protein Btru_056618 [Bulinus truncatus]
MWSRRLDSTNRSTWSSRPAMLPVNDEIDLQPIALLEMLPSLCGDDVALPGFHSVFKKQADEEKEHAEKLMKYQNKRGGRKPEFDQWAQVLANTGSTAAGEKVNQSLLDLQHCVAGTRRLTDGRLFGVGVSSGAGGVHQNSNYTNLKRVLTLEVSDRDSWQVEEAMSIIEPDAFLTIRPLHRTSVSSIYVSVFRSVGWRHDVYSSV